jgi:TonB family protein
MPRKVCVLIAMLFTVAATGFAAQQPAAAPSASADVYVTPEEAQHHLLKRVDPVYPALAQTARIQGVVQLEVTINENGSTEIKLISGHPMLAPAAIEAVKQWKYRPFEKDGKPIVVKTDVEVSLPEHIDQEDAKREDKFQSVYWPAEREGEEALKRGDYDTARKKLLIARAAAAERGDSKWLELAGTIAAMGGTEFGAKNYPEAERLYKESLAMHEKHQQPDEAEVGGALQSLANVYMAQDEPDKAEPLLLRSVEIYKKRIETAPMSEAKAAYGRHIAWGSFWLVAIGTSSHRLDMAQAHCKDVMEYSKWVEADQRDIMTRGCAEVASKAKE